MTVDNGAFSTSVDVSDWSSGNVDVWIGFQCDVTTGQPTAIVEQYGSELEPDWSKCDCYGPYKRAEQEIVLQLRGLD